MKDIKRREFIKMSAGAGIASVAIPGAFSQDHDVNDLE